MKADTVLQVPGRGFAGGTLRAQRSARSLGLSLRFVLGLMAEMLGVQESKYFPVIILSLGKLYLLMRAICLQFTPLCKRASAGTVTQKAMFVSFCNRWSESVCWCQETGPFIPCWEENFPFFFLSFFPFQGEKLCIVSLVPHRMMEE